MLKLHFKDNRYSPLWVVDKIYSIGSAHDNQLVLDEAGVDPHHARLIKEGEHYVLRDANSMHG
jgi:pSer/pThr/pTyr-binding forkhead associated (FHA) protein